MNLKSHFSEREMKFVIFIGVVMSIPDYQTIMLPFLKFAGDGHEHSLREATEFLANEFQLSEQERKELLPSGTQRLFNNRVAWASTYLRKAGLLESKKRGFFQIAQRGKDALAKNLDRIDNKYLEQFPEFIEFKTPKSKPEKPVLPPKILPDDKNPEEILESAFQELNDSLASELIDTIKSISPEFFERLVIDVLIKIGYGGTRKEAGQAVGRTKDGGIDGIIKEDKLGLDIVYIQAKKWENTVGRPEIQKFAGALQGQRARKGIFITTSNFSKEALDYAGNIENKIILIDGQQLAELMIENNVGVSTTASYEIKKIDSDYFIEE
jgi:restriction system protein